VCAKGHHANGDALVFVKRSIEKREQEKLDREQEKSKRRADKDIISNKIMMPSSRKVTLHRWTVLDLKTMVQWFKLPTDPIKPAQKQDLMQRYEQTKLRTVTHLELPYAPCYS
jgi:hypothetical protein